MTQTPVKPAVKAEQPARTFAFQQRIAEVQKNPFKSRLYFGASRAGKTTLIASGAYDPRTSPMLLLNMGGGISSADGVDPALLTAVPIRDWKDYNDAYDYVKKAKHGFKAVAIDSISETHIFSLITVVDYEVEHNDRRKDKNMTEQSDFGHSMLQIRRFMREWQALPIHTFFTAQATTMTVARVGVVTVPFMFGQLKEEIVGMFDDVVFLSIEEVKAAKVGDPNVVKHVAVLQNDPTVRAGIRTPIGKRLKKSKIVLPWQNGMSKLLDACVDYADDKQE